ncbi:Metallo-dependent hydrolase [Pisolithus thermaeus]|nr:Metallo-dependent hydrolase [Pisolithus thermaeus]
MHIYIHLDKCFILEQCGPLLSGSLEEALHVTSKAKARFPEHQANLYARASRLVEIDRVVGMVCLETALRLKSEWEGICEIQTASFAQEALFTSVDAEAPGENFELLVTALDRPGVSVVGSAPWRTKNIAEILALSKAGNLHADFHMDYNLDAGAEPIVWELIQRMRETGRSRATTGHKRVTVGHATPLGMFSAEEWTTCFPLELVSLPQSNLYMMGRPCEDGTRTHSVTVVAKAAIGCDSENTDDNLTPRIGDLADFPMANCCTEPPFDRTTVLGGRVVATRRALRWTALKC